MSKIVLLKNALVYTKGGFLNRDIVIKDGLIASLDDITVDPELIVDCTGKTIIPGLVDVHVHFREPGFEYKETIKSGAAAAKRGGYTTVCTMPNLNPAPDSVENINIQIDLAKNNADINIYPYACITKGQKGEGELVDFQSLAPLTFGFSDDGRGVQKEELMRLAMLEAKKYDKHIVAHCEDESLLEKGGCIHKGKYAAENGFVGISSESEWKQVERDIQLVRETGCKYHICHISTKETVELVRQAKKDGLPVTCETAPHYLILCDEDLQDDGKFKMNPPLRSSEDREALISGILDGTIDMIATDHAPHSLEEKSKGLSGSMFGIVGIEIAFPLLYTHFVKKGIFSLEKLVEIMSVNPRKVFGFSGGIEVGDKAEIAIFDMEKHYAINSEDFVSMGKVMPFDGYEVYSQCEDVIVGDKLDNK